MVFLSSWGGSFYGNMESTPNAVSPETPKPHCTTKCKRKRCKVGLCQGLFCIKHCSHEAPDQIAVTSTANAAVVSPEPHKSLCDLRYCKKALCICEGNFCAKCCTCSRSQKCRVQVSPSTPRLQRSSAPKTLQNIRMATELIMKTPEAMLRERTPEPKTIDELYDHFPPQDISVKKSMPSEASRHGPRSSNLAEMGKGSWSAMVRYLYHIVLICAGIICSQSSIPLLLLKLAGVVGMI